MSWARTQCDDMNYTNMQLSLPIPINMFAVCSTEILEYSTPTWTIKIKFEIFKYVWKSSIFMPKNEYRTYTCVFTDLNQAGNICQERSKENRYHFLGPSRRLSLECFKRIYLWLALSVGISADNQTWRNSGMHIQIHFNLSVGFGWHSSWCSPQYSDIAL